eukprot:scaffold5185_cov110-Isochrysis_galbana.AAC.5
MAEVDDGSAAGRRRYLVHSNSQRMPGCRNATEGSCWERRLAALSELAGSWAFHCLWQWSIGCATARLAKAVQRYAAASRRPARAQNPRDLAAPSGVLTASRASAEGAPRGGGRASSAIQGVPPRCERNCAVTLNCDHQSVRWQGQGYARRGQRGPASLPRTWVAPSWLALRVHSSWMESTAPRSPSGHGRPRAHTAQASCDSRSPRFGGMSAASRRAAGGRMALALRPPAKSRMAGTIGTVL